MKKWKRCAAIEDGGSWLSPSYEFTAAVTNARNEKLEQVSNSIELIWIEDRTSSEFAYVIRFISLYKEVLSFMKQKISGIGGVFAQQCFQRQIKFREKTMNCRKLVLTMLGIVCCASTVLAQPDAATQERMKKHQNSMANQQVMFRLISILQNKALKEELEIPDYQLAELRIMATDFQKEFAKHNGKNQARLLELQEEMKTGDQAAAIAEIQEIQGAMFDICDQAMSGVEDVLLPQQVERIKQIARQEMLKYQSGFGDEFGVVFGLSRELDLSTSQSQKLREAIVEARKEYYEKLAKLKAETHKKILDSLPADKKDKVKEILGERYDGDSERRKMFENALKKRPRD